MNSTLASAAPGTFFSNGFKTMIQRPRRSTVTDAFARAERIGSNFEETSPKRTGRVAFEVGKKSYILAFESVGGSAIWVLPVLESAKSRWGAERGWDGYDAAPTDITLFVSLLRCLEMVMSDSSKPPLVIPLADGGVQSEWHNGNKTLEIVVPADEHPTYYFYDGDSEVETEGTVQEDLERVKTLIATF